MKKWGFKQWYAVIFLAVFIIYGWLYLMEKRYVTSDTFVVDTWKSKMYITPNEFNGE